MASRQACPSKAHSAAAARVSGQGINLVWPGNLRNSREVDTHTNSALRCVHWISAVESAQSARHVALDLAIDCGNLFRQAVEDAAWALARAPALPPRPPQPLGGGGGMNGSVPADGLNGSVPADGMGVASATDVAAALTAAFEAIPRVSAIRGGPTASELLRQYRVAIGYAQPPAPPPGGGPSPSGGGGGGGTDVGLAVGLSVGLAAAATLLAGWALQARRHRNLWGQVGRAYAAMALQPRRNLRGQARTAFAGMALRPHRNLRGQARRAFAGMALQL
eukprot:355379-Chlamydomonas_euryale.AAC.2